MPCDLRIHPAYLILHCVCLFKTVEGSLQVKKIHRSNLKRRQKKSDQDDDCRWTTTLRRFGTAPSTNLVSEQGSDGIIERNSQVVLGGIEQPVVHWRIWNPALSQRVLCEIYRAVCVIAASGRWE